uniref:Breast cancer metastasis-suppressor 1-like protein-A n=1 Tax=Gouania willdenowi TaxID=441366 RepID=A0A8C5DQS0_GOUWI
TSPTPSPRCNTALSFYILPLIKCFLPFLREVNSCGRVRIIICSPVSEMDEEDCERRRMECLDEMSNLEKQFNDLRDQLYRERLSQVNSKLSEVEAGRASEYLEPLAVLLENMQVRTKVAGIYRELCLDSVKNKYDCEIQAASQHWESEKLLLLDTVQSELEEKIRRLEEDRHSIDITSGNNQASRACTTYSSWICVDWTAIRKVCVSVCVSVSITYL